MLMGTDVAAANRLYGDRIGLESLIESDEFVTVSFNMSGQGGSRIRAGGSRSY
jgi:hypothetical protein